MTTIDEVVSQSKQKYTLALLLCLGVSLCVISFISLRLKRQLHNLEPSEIYQLLEERNAMLDQIEAAVFIIDKTHAISLANQSAKDLALTKMQEEFLIGKTIEDIFTDFHTLDLKQYHDQLFRFCEEDYLVTISPISVKGSLRGYLIFLREAANAINTLEQLVYTTTYASALQAQTHKFMNQLHVIYGLVDIAYYDQLKIYLDSILEPESEIVTSLSVLIKEPLLASFLIGEQEKYKELNCKLQFEMVSDIPACQSKHQLNNCLKIYQYIHTTCLTHLKPKEVLMSISYKTNYLISQYSFWIKLSLPSNLKLSLILTISNSSCLIQGHYFIKKSLINTLLFL
ncbi:Spo0B domain-containing protein [Streptococcus didelphis]|uniref:Spo0B domain-containing protein n=1 Tax=Streptococcus didelphis TaxID=102886 RepID=A0ABY9LIV7_9STRE|nr:Spo0B domain-containing protein [Streptococcus didelphis]